MSNKVKNSLIALLGLTTTASLAANVLIYKRYSHQRPLVRIGDEVIPMSEYRDAVDTEHGKPVLNRIAFGAMIRQAARKGGVLPDDKEVDAHLDRIRRVTPERLQAAERDAYRMKVLRQVVLTDLAFENLRIKDVKVTPQEVERFYRANPALFARPTQHKASMVLTQNRVDAETAADLLRRPDMSLSVIARQPRLAVVGVGGFDPDWSLFSVEDRERIAKALAGARKGDVVTLALGGGYMVIRSDDVSRANVPPLQEVREQAERAARLAKAEERESSSQVLARLYREAEVKVEIPRYAPFFAEIASASRQPSAAGSEGGAPSPAGGKQTAMAR